MAAPKQFCSLLAFVACIIIGSSSIVGAKWCVARYNADRSELFRQVDYVCTHGVDCSPIAQGGNCFTPNDLVDHASYVFNAYYVLNHGKFNPGSCYFNGAGMIIDKDPSTVSCVYPSS